MIAFMKLPQSWVTILFISLPLIGFYLGTKYQGTNFNEIMQPGSAKEVFSIKKTAGDPDYSGSFKYELWKDDTSGKSVIYSVVNWNGFRYDVSEDKKYIAILNYGESTGDETFIIIRDNGQVVKDFGNLDSKQTLSPFYWTEHFYWFSEGVPIVEQPMGVIRVDADTLKIDRFVNTELSN